MTEPTLRELAQAALSASEAFLSVPDTVDDSEEMRAMEEAYRAVDARLRLGVCHGGQDIIRNALPLVAILAALDAERAAGRREMIAMVEAHSDEADAENKRAGSSSYEEGAADALDILLSEMRRTP